MYNCSINFLIGLPASGKSHFATLERELDIRVHVVSYEDLQLKGYKHFNTNTLIERIAGWFDIKEVDKRYDEILLDGMFVNINYIKEIIQRFENLGFVNFKFTLFEPNIEACLLNDRFRRYEAVFRNDKWEKTLQSSAYSILNTKLPINDLSKLSKKLGYAIKTQPCFAKTDKDIFIDWLLFNDIRDISAESYQKSNKPDIEDNLLSIGSWCCGGNYGSCYDDELIDCDVGIKPKVMDTNLGKLMIKYHIPIKELSKLIYEYPQTFSVSDYYGGKQENKILVIDINKLFNIFKHYNKLDWSKLV